jgi:hypothetical protein
MKTNLGPRRDAHGADPPEPQGAPDKPGSKNSPVRKASRSLHKRVKKLPKSVNASPKEGRARRGRRKVPEKDQGRRRRRGRQSVKEACQVRDNACVPHWGQDGTEQDRAGRADTGWDGLDHGSEFGRERTGDGGWSAWDGIIENGGAKENRPRK